jgi:cubilin
MIHQLILLACLCLVNITSALPSHLLNSTKPKALAEGRPACPDTIFSETTYGFINSPHYPSNYPDDIDCYYKITVPENNTVSLVLYSMNLYEGCCDYLALYNGDNTHRQNLIKKLHGKGNLAGAGPLAITYTTKNTNVMTVHFRADMQDNDRGFYARYDAIPSSDNDNTNPANSKCPPDTYKGPFGVIVSPKWPHYYQNEAACDYFIQVAKGSRIKLVSNYFNTESIWDHLTIHDGNSTKSRKLKKLSGTIDTMPSLESTSNAMTLSFLSNTAIYLQGYSFTYYEVSNSDN